MVAIVVSPAPANAEDAAAFTDTSGWRTFGAQLGGVIGAGIIAGMLASGGPFPNAPQPERDALLATVGWGLVAGELVLVLGVGEAFGRAAQAEGWHSEAGWGAAGAVPGSVVGAVLAIGLVLAANPRSSPNLALGTAGLGAVVGGLGGYAVARGSAARGHKFRIEIALCWLGMLVGGSIGANLAGAAQMAPGIVMITAAAGGFALAALGYVLSPVR